MCLYTSTFAIKDSQQNRKEPTTVNDYKTGENPTNF